MYSDDNQPVIRTVSPDTVARYLESHEQVERALGASPGAEFLMSLAVEYQDTTELVDLFSGEIIKALQQTTAATHK
jgi:hypothetical protein